MFDMFCSKNHTSFQGHLLKPETAKRNDRNQTIETSKTTETTKTKSCFMSFRNEAQHELSCILTFDRRSSEEVQYPSG